MPSEAVQVKTPPTAASKPVMVFGTDLAGSHESETATLAVRLWGAEPGVGSGETGFAYALPFRSTTGGLLGPDVISNYVETLRHRMEVQPDTIFQILRFGCEKDAHDDATMAKIFADMPANCQLPGLWRRQLDPSHPARLLICDPGANLKTPEWQEKLKQYLSLNAPLWNAPAIELVTVGSARVVVANDLAAKALQLRHRIFGPDEARYGSNAMIAAEIQATWYATHLLNLFDFEQTGQPAQIRILSTATRAGLEIDQINIGGTR